MGMSNKEAIEELLMLKRQVKMNSDSDKALDYAIGILRLIESADYTDAEVTYGTPRIICDNNGNYSFYEEKGEYVNEFHRTDSRNNRA